MKRQNIISKIANVPVVLHVIGLLAVATCLTLTAGIVAQAQSVPADATEIRGSLGMQNSFSYQGSQKNHQFTILDAFTDVRVHPSTDSTESEVSIAVSPVDTKILLASANTTDYPPSTVYGTGAYFSIDGGLTWGGMDRPPTGDNSGDPCVAIDRNGYFYIGGIAANDGQGVMKSTNNGATWTYIQIANPTTGLLDKPHLTVDNSVSSGFVGNLYDAWSDFSTADRAITTRRSTDHGATWIDQQAISSGFAASNLAHQGVNLQTGPDGKVYACWAVRDKTSPFTERGIGFNKSTDGGHTWGTPYYAINNILGIRQSPNPTLGIRTNSFPSMGVDRQNGIISIVWANIGKPGVNTGDPDIYIIRSTDQGATWHDTTRVNSDASGNGAIQFFAWLSADPLIANSLFVGFFDNRAHIGTDTCEYYVAHSTDGGLTWSNAASSDAPFAVVPLPNFGSYGGDYAGMATRTGSDYPMWYAKAPSVNHQGWTSPTIPVDLSIQNTTVSEAATYEASNSIASGPAVTNTNAASVVYHVSGSSTPGVDLVPGFSASSVGGGGQVFRAYVGSGPASSPVALRGPLSGRKILPGWRRPGLENAIPTEYSLLDNHPNPFNPSTVIAYGLPEATNVLLRVYNALGQEVATLIDQYQPAGYKSVTFDASRLASGVYFYRLSAGAFTSVKRMLLIR